MNSEKNEVYDEIIELDNTSMGLGLQQDRFNAFITKYFSAHVETESKLETEIISTDNKTKNLFKAIEGISNRWLEKENYKLLERDLKKEENILSTYTTLLQVTIFTPFVIAICGHLFIENFSSESTSYTFLISSPFILFFAIKRENILKKYKIFRGAFNSNNNIKSLDNIKHKGALNYYKKAISIIEKNKSQKITFISSLREQALKEIKDNYTKTIEKIESDKIEFLNQFENQTEKIEATFKPFPELTKSNNLLNTSEVKNYVHSNIRLGDLSLFFNSSKGKEVLSMPFALPFFNKKNIIFKSDIASNEEAVQAINYFLIRAMLSLPPGKIKLILIDPVGLGSNFSSILSLNEELYGLKVWVETRHIEDQLLNLSRHMENVIQKYLKDEYDDIASYNTTAKQVEEPYRILVVTNFPSGFNDSSAHKLKSIMQNGPKVGVNTLIHIENGNKFPYNFNIEEIEKVSSVINLSAGNIETPQVRALKENSLILLEKHDTSSIKKIIQEINEGYENKESIKVPFEENILDHEYWWKSECNNQFIVPIGKQGANEIQAFKFDNETIPYGLIVGMPGSGKSNLLHVLITNSIIQYSPDELEIYLVDFKGGVEFVPYAEKKIPHAKVIAIESEREFGLSVLEGLENELFRRETKFRNNNVNRLDEFRKKSPEVRLPRILLIVDEFQEFFSEDDSIRNRSEQIIERIVRKGRAFGINLLFSTQSLSGNPLNKGIKDLIALRIALMCSDKDSRLILAEDNPGAKLINRPGEGIYNSNKGLIENNSRFQTYFLDRDSHLQILDRVVEFQKKSGWIRPDKQIIFRGDAKSYLEECEEILRFKPLKRPKRVDLMLGEPVSISQDIKAVLRQQSGSNLLLVGSDEELALRILMSCFISIAAQHQKSTAKFYIVNLLNIDSPFYSIPKTYLNNFPFDFTIVKNNNLLLTLEELKTLIDNRIQNEELINSNIFVSTISTQRGRRLRKEGFSEYSEEGKLLSYILKEGPEVGVFSLIHFDNINNLERSFRLDILNEFSQRVALQMSADDSRDIVDSIIASKLGRERGIFYNETEGFIKKFRPFTFPIESWVDNKILSKI